MLMVDGRPVLLLRNDSVVGKWKDDACGENSSSSEINIMFTCEKETEVGGLQQLQTAN
jgi:hypothetical protein